MAEETLRSLAFRTQREPAWLELERLVAAVERRGLGSLGPSELSRLPALYRGALSALAVARSISLDRNVLEYLESLSGRAYLAVYGTRRLLRDAASDFFRRRFPATVREFRWQVLAALVLLALGALAGHLLTAADPDRFYAFVSPAMAQGRGPASTTESLRAVLYDTVAGADMLAAFAMFLFTHNAQIGMLAFALGFAGGVPSGLLLFVNGLGLGAFSALYRARGLGGEFWAWVLPHGVTELTAVALCGGAGLAVAQALAFPGQRSRLAALAERGRQAGTLVLGAVVLFFLAGLVEGLFRQRVHALPARWGVAAASLALWAVYFWRAGRTREPAA